MNKLWILLSFVGAVGFAFAVATSPADACPGGGSAGAHSVVAE